VILLDRDGVLNHDRPDSVKSADDLVILPGVGRAVAALNRAGYTVLIVTNQAMIGRGVLTEDDVETIHDALRRRLSREGGSIAGFYVCPHRPDEGCDCRKPSPGLLLRAARDWGFDCAATWFVGDDVKDVEAGRAAGCRTALVLTGKGRKKRSHVPHVPAFDDLAAFVTWFLEGGEA